MFEESEKFTFDTAKTLKSAKTQRSQRRAKFCAFAELLRFSGDKKGVVLYMVLATVLIVTILANVVLNIILSQSRLTHHQISRIRAYYASQAGMNLALEKLRTGTWQYNTDYCINCTTGVPPEKRVSDSDIPYVVMINIGQQGVGGPNNTTPINITTTYTYTP